MHTDTQACQCVLMYAHTLYIHICGKSIPGSRNGKCKAPEVGMSLIIREENGGLYHPHTPNLQRRKRRLGFLGDLPKATE